jgi:hypothetical protein
MLLGLERGFSGAAQRLAVDSLARRVLGADAHLKTGALARRRRILIGAAARLSIAWLFLSVFYFVVIRINLNMHRQIVNAFGGFHHRFGTSDARASCGLSSSAVDSSCIATHASAINSVACGPMMCTPRISSYFFSLTIFTKPSSSPMMRALPEAENGNLPTFTS